MEKLIKLFNEKGVRYLLLGGQAVRLEGLPRFSMDWDFYIPSHDLRNIELINELLRSVLDLPLLPLGPRGENFIQTYQIPQGILQFHLAGPGLPPFDEAEARAVIHEDTDGVPVRCLSLPDLLESKRKAGRPQDQADIIFLQKKLSRTERNA